MKRTQILAAAACTLMVFSLLGCGATNKLQSIQLNVVAINGQNASGLIINLPGAGATLQLQALGEYSNGKTTDLTNEVTYKVVVDPNSSVALLPPCQAPNCPVGSPGAYTAGTVEYSPTGMLTAVEPAECTWANSGTVQSPIWSITGDYMVTVSLGGVTSQPVFVPVGSAAGPGGGPCGPV